MADLAASNWVRGAAENKKATRVYHENNMFGGITASSYRFG